MNRKKIRLLAFLLLSVCFAISACSGTVRYTHKADPEIVAKRPGPPPHAPAHGYRHKHHDGVELAYDAKIGVYVVVGHEGYYYHENRYYRINHASWESSKNIKKGWAPVSEKKMPPGLLKKHASNKKNKKK